MAESEGKITAREVERLRREWLAATQDLKDLQDSFAQLVGAANIGRHPDDGVDDTATARAEIGAAQQEVDDTRARYEDCRAEHQAQQADSQVTATNRLALAAVVATVVQAIAAVIQLCQGSH